MVGFSSLLLASVTLAGQTWALPPPEHPAMHDTAAISRDLQIRAAPDSPSGSYAPAKVDCPSNRPAIRVASTLSQQEASWLPLRRNATIPAMTDLLRRANIPGFDVAAFMQRVRSNSSELPNVAIAVSGGGYRALMNGAGFISAADSRTKGSTDAGGIGGLLQASTYLAGLSGGGWLVGSIYSNNFSTVQSLQTGTNGSNVWQFQNSIFRGPQSSGISILNRADYWATVAREVEKKDKAGFDTSITDYWGRALSFQLINATDGGPAYTFSSIADDPNLVAGNIPLPILVADGRAPNEKIVSINATVYEFNPFEMGSWDPTTYGFAPLRYLGSNFSAGVVPQDGSCIRGFDQAGFVMGTSSSLFNQFLLQNITAATSSLPTFIQDLLKSILTSLDENNNDIAQYRPNPFRDWMPKTNLNTNQSQLTLVDGGEDLQNIPLHPLIQPFRAVDVIFAVDSSADTTYNWPNGTALRATYDRAGTPIANGTLFPPVPDAETFINLRLNQRPTFFGCDVTNFTLNRQGQGPPPLVVYIPNAPYTASSNVSTFDPSYELSERNDIIRNGYNAATQGNATVEKEWPVCVACAILSRSLSRTNTKVPDACTACFQRHCWNGTIDSRAVESYEPAFIIGNQTTQSAGVRTISGTSNSVLGVLVIGVMTTLMFW